jgi:hypothetical protein
MGPLATHTLLHACALLAQHALGLEWFLIFEVIVQRRFDVLDAPQLSTAPALKAPTPSLRGSKQAIALDVGAMACTSYQIPQRPVHRTRESPFHCLGSRHTAQGSSSPSSLPLSRLYGLSSMAWFLLVPAALFGMITRGSEISRGPIEGLNCPTDAERLGPGPSPGIPLLLSRRQSI